MTAEVVRHSIVGTTDMDDLQANLEAELQERAPPEEGGHLRVSGSTPGQRSYRRG